MITLTEPRAMPEEKLTSTQQTALSSLIVGHTVSEAANDAGVHRNTVHRWLKSDEQFQQARHQAQCEAQRTVEAKLHDSATAAMECIERCLEKGDSYVAEQLLKGLGCYDGMLKDVGSDEAVSLAQEALQHSALAEMFDRTSVGTALAGQFAKGSIPGDTHAPNDNPHHGAAWEENHRVPSTEYSVGSETDSISNRMATGQGIQTAEPSGQGRTYEVPEGMERYASAFSTPDDAVENSQPTAPSRRSVTPVPDNEEASGTGCHDLHEQPNATSNDGYADLSTQQTTAMMALQTGQSIEDAADTAQTEPETVYQWLHGDYTFQAAMNRCAEERRRAVHARLQQLATLAADLIDRKIRQGNGRLAVRLLKGLGYLERRT